jgi:hypothetical protein
MQLGLFLLAAIFIVSMAIAFQGLAMAQTRRKTAIAVSLGVVSVCGFAVLIATLF